HRGPEHRLHVRVARTRAAERVRSRDSRPVQEHPHPTRPRAAMGTQHPATRAALGAPGYLGAGAAGQRELSRAIGRARPPNGARTRASAGDQPRVHVARRWRAERYQLALRVAGPAARRQPPIRAHRQPHGGRDRQARFLADRERRAAVVVRSTQRALLSGKASVLPGRARTVRHAELADLYADHRAAGGGGQAHRHAGGHGHRIPVGCRQFGRVGIGDRESGVQHSAGAAGMTRGDSGSLSGPLWSWIFERQGHTIQLHYSMSGIDPAFRTQTGFVSRSNIAGMNLEQAVTLYGKRGSLIETWTGDFSANHDWIYTRFADGKSPNDLRWHISNEFTLRGGWVAVANVFLERYGYDPSIYTNYYIVHQNAGGPDT